MVTLQISAGLLLLAALGVLRRSPAATAFARVLPPPQSPRRPSPASGAPRSPRGAGLAGGLGALAVAVVLPHPIGFAAAPVVFIGAGRFIAKLSVVREKRPPAHLLATAADLLAACLEAGAVPASALAVTGTCLSAPWGDLFTAAGHSLGAGEPIDQALPERGPLAPIAAVFRRSWSSGSSMTGQLLAVADQLRSDDHFDRLARARRVSVLSALPLGLCMLPAFLLLAVVPAVAGLGAGLLH